MTVWRLMVFSVPDRHGGLLRRLKFHPTRKNEGHWFRIFDPDGSGADDQRAIASQALRMLKSAGLKTSWSEVEKKAETRAPRRRSDPSGEIKVIELETAKNRRLAREALKLAEEERRQADQRAQADVAARARSAIRRSKGDLTPK